MPTLPIEDMFNLTFKVERPTKERDEYGNTKPVRWDTIEEDVKGALDDYCQQEKTTVEAYSRRDVTPYALYCRGDVKIKEDDQVTLKDETGEELVFAVKAVRNPMRRYRYLVVWCGPT